jgi:hypothetical protein
VAGRERGRLERKGIDAVMWYYKGYDSKRDTSLIVPLPFSSIASIGVREHTGLT